MNVATLPESFVDADRAAALLGVKPRRVLEMARFLPIRWGWLSEYMALSAIGDLCSDLGKEVEFLAHPLANLGSRFPLLRRALKNTQIIERSHLGSPPPAAIAAWLKLKPGQWFGFHNFRHGLASWLVNSGTDVKAVQGLLRHSNVTTTLGLYAHTVNGPMLAAQDSLMRAMKTGSRVVN